MKMKFRNTAIMVFLAIAGVWLGGCDNTKSESALPEPPAAPEQLLATDGTFGNQVQLSWNAATGAETYKIYRAIDSATGEFRLMTGNVTGTEWADTAVTPTRMYYYSVMASNAGGTSPMSNSDLGYAGELAPEPPFPPSDLVASQTYLHHVYLRWNTVENAERYHVYSADSINGNYTRITDEDGMTPGELNSIDLDGNPGTTSDNYSFDDSRAIEGRALYYKVSAENLDGEGLSGQPVMGWYPYDAPENPPAGVTASDGTYSNKVIITWNEVTEANEYSVYRSLSAYPDPAICPTVSTSYSNIGSTSSLSFDDTGLAADDYNVYCYAVKAENSAGESILSDPDKGSKSSSGSAVPGAPISLSATTNETNQITVSWDRTDAYATEYEIFRSLSANGDYGADPIGTVADNGSISYTYADTTVTTDTAYYYRVRASSAGGDSALSDHTQGMALPSVPAAPTVTASDGADWDSITITWTEAPGAVTYKLYRSTSASGPWDASTLIASKLTGTSYVDSAITFAFDTDYYYAVRGVNTGGDGEVGSDDGNVELATPAVPTIGDPGYRDFSISWAQIEGCQGYMVYWVRSTVAWGDVAGSNTGQINVSGNATLGTTLLDGTLYYNYRFRVQAYVIDGGGNIVHSGPISEWSDWNNAD